jgi:hypothetical protein
VLTYCGGNKFSAQLPETCPYSHTLTPRRTPSLSGTKPGSTYLKVACVSRYQRPGGRLPALQTGGKRTRSERTHCLHFCPCTRRSFYMKFLVNFTASLSSTPIAIPTIRHAQSPCYPVQEEVGTLSTITMGKRKNCPCA